MQIPAVLRSRRTIVAIVVAAGLLGAGGVAVATTSATGGPAPVRTTPEPTVRTTPTPSSTVIATSPGKPEPTPVRPAPRPKISVTPRPREATTSPLPVTPVYPTPTHR